jgi:hypothetical protein
MTGHGVQHPQSRKIEHVATLTPEPKSN